MAGVDTSQQISTCRFLMVAGVAIDVIERQVVQPFYDANIGRLLMLPLERGKFDTSCLPIIPRAA